MAARPDLFEAALALPAGERAELVHELLASLDEPLDDPESVRAGWEAEIERRLADIDSGKTVLLTEDEVRARLGR